MSTDFNVLYREISFQKLVYLYQTATPDIQKPKTKQTSFISIHISHKSQIIFVD